MDDYLRRVRLRAYLIWEREGSPEGREVEHWLQAEREIANGEDAAGLKAGREYDNGVKEFERSGGIEKAAEEARKALDGKEKDELQRAEEVGRRTGRGEDAGNKR